jgi:hypothetical protein
MTLLSRVMWLLLVIYTLFYVVFFGFQSALIPQLFNGQADIFSSSFFNLMGVVPIVFLMYATLNQRKNRWSWLPYAGGFFGGAYSVLLGRLSWIAIRKPLHMIQKIILLISIFACMWLYGYAWFFGNPITYFSLFFSDALVGIMTVDFLILWIWSILLAKHHYRQWFWAFIPMIGFAGLMLLATIHIHPKDELIDNQ